MTVLLSKLKNNGILELTINRPDKLNALNDEVLESFSEAFTTAKSNPEVKAVLITGSGKAFCAGADINRLLEADGLSGYDFAKQGQNVFAQLENLGKPSIAAVNGYAFGGGCELAISASMRVASEKAVFGQPEVKLGVIPGYGGTQRLSRLIGKGRALDLCLTGRSIDAQQALAFGLVSQVVNGDTLTEVAETILLGILDMAPLAIESTLKAINQGYDMPLADALDFEALYFAKCCTSQDKGEGVRAFLEKRKAQFKGY